jgi:hypothetical protein
MLKTLGDFVLFYLLGWFGGHFCFNLLGGGSAAKHREVGVQKKEQSIAKPYYVRTYVRCTYVCTCSWSYVCAYVRAYVRMCVRTYVRTYMVVPRRHGYSIATTYWDKQTNTSSARQTS